MTPARTPRDRGDVMLATTVFVIALMLGAFALVSAGQAWGQRRHVQGAADAAARAAAQVTLVEARAGSTIDPGSAALRAAAVAAGVGVAVVGVDVAADGRSVSVTVTGGVRYSFPAPGFPTSMTATGLAVAQRGIVAGG